MSEDIEKIVEAEEDAEFAALIREGLNSSFEAEDICVSDELIARTMKSIQAQPIPLLRRKRFIRIAGSIAAALIIGVIGISALTKGAGMKKSESTETATNSLAFMTDFTSEAANDESFKDSTAAGNSLYDGEAPVPTFSLVSEFGVDNGASDRMECEEESQACQDSKVDTMDTAAFLNKCADDADVYPNEVCAAESEPMDFTGNAVTGLFVSAYRSIDLAVEQMDSDMVLEYLDSVAEEELFSGQFNEADVDAIVSDENLLLTISDPDTDNTVLKHYIEIYDTAYVNCSDVPTDSELQDYHVEIFRIESGASVVDAILSMK